MSPVTSNSAVYCAGCNARFPAVGDEPICPRCGAQAERVVDPSLADTLLIRRDNLDPHECEDDDAQFIGRRIGIYRCDSLLGRGGMGHVYLAHHETLHRKCALKVLKETLTRENDDFVERFWQEGRSSAALVHPNVVTTHSIGECDGTYFLEMEFVAGRSLQQLVNDEGRLTPLRAASLVAGVASGLSAAHRQGVIHRDLKPDNVLLTERGIPKLGDFGLSKRVRSDSLANSERYLCGTPNFMAPELLRGEPATPRSDVYALGVTFYLLLTGQLPHTAAKLRELQQLVEHEPLPSIRKYCPDVPLEMVECVKLMTAKSPEIRPCDGIEAFQLISAILGAARDVESMLIEAFDNTPDVTWKRAGSKYELQLKLPDGRHQRLFVEPSEHAARERLLLIYSICCDAKPEFYEEALRLNSEVLHGSVAIREVDGVPRFVMIDTYPRSTVDAEEIRRSALEVAYRADAIENLLTGNDVH